MQAYDVIMLLVLIATAFMGFRKGLAWQIASVAAIVVSYFVAVNFREELAHHLSVDPPWNTFLAMLILYIATSFVIWLAFQMVRGFIDRAKLKEFDQQLGALFGVAKGILLCVIITFFAVTLLGEDLARQIIQSKSGFYIARLLDEADAVMPKELHRMLHPYLDQLDRELHSGGGVEPREGQLQELKGLLEAGRDAGLWDRDEAAQTRTGGNGREASPRGAVDERSSASPQDRDPYFRSERTATESGESSEGDPRQRRFGFGRR